MEIQESGEMYLETILKIKEKKSQVRAVDVVEELDYSKSSVSRGVNLLKARGFITIGLDGNIEFTEEGRKLAVKIYERHKILTAYLTKLGVAPAVAERDACRIEHVISTDSFDAIKKHAELFNKKD